MTLGGVPTERLAAALLRAPRVRQESSYYPTDRHIAARDDLPAGTSDQEAGRRGHVRLLLTDLILGDPRVRALFDEWDDSTGLGDAVRGAADAGKRLKELTDNPEITEEEGEEIKRLLSAGAPVVSLLETVDLTEEARLFVTNLVVPLAAQKRLTDVDWSWLPPTLTSEWRRRAWVRHLGHGGHPSNDPSRVARVEWPEPRVGRAIAADEGLDSVLDELTARQKSLVARREHGGRVRNLPRYVDWFYRRWLKAPADSVNAIATTEFPLIGSRSAGPTDRGKDIRTGLETVAKHLSANPTGDLHVP